MTVLVLTNCSLYTHQTVFLWEGGRIISMFLYVHVLYC